MILKGKLDHNRNQAKDPNFSFFDPRNHPQQTKYGHDGIGRVPDYIAETVRTGKKAPREYRHKESHKKEFMFFTFQQYQETDPKAQEKKMVEKPSAELMFTEYIVRKKN
jgi:hypothetical protein